MSDQTVEEGAEVADEPAAPEAPTRFGCPLVHNKIDVLFPTREQWLEVATALLDDGFRMCVDLTAVDYLTYEPARHLPEGIAPERFEIVASFLNHKTRERIRIRAQVPADDTTIDSLNTLFPGSDYLEREVFDMFGIIFEGHPDLSRILMPETWVGHPLRKDYAIGAIPVQFKGTK